MLCTSTVVLWTGNLEFEARLLTLIAVFAGITYPPTEIILPGGDILGNATGTGGNIRRNSSMTVLRYNSGAVEFRVTSSSLWNEPQISWIKFVMTEGYLR